MNKIEELDLTKLDLILEKHAFEFQEATSNLPQLRKDVATTKLELETLEAELNLKIRARLEQAGEKFTEAKILAMIKTNVSYRQAHAKMIDARFEYDRVDLVKDVFLQRESSIKNLVSLYNAQYWSLSDITHVPKKSK